MNDKQKMLIAVLGVVITMFAVTAVTASDRILTTPLFIFRMEQVSSQMNFLPTSMGSFVYTTEKGCTLQYNVPERCGGVDPLGIIQPEGGITHWHTCLSTCQYTCPYTCVPTCKTCLYTCNTCTPCTEETCETCVPSCYETCVESCVATCVTCTPPPCILKVS